MPDNEGVYLSTSNIFNLDVIRNAQLSPEEMKQVLIKIVQAFKETNEAVNLKETGIYSTVETLNGQLFPPNPALTSLSPETPEDRQVQRILVIFGALPNATTKSIAHNVNVTASTEWTCIYGAASKQTTTYGGIPVPYIDTSGSLGSNVGIRVDNQFVHITTTADLTAYTKCNVVLEYLQD